MTKQMTEGRPFKLIFLFTLPLLAGNLFQQLYTMMDTFIVGRALGVDALAAVGCTGGILFLIIGFVQGLTTGTSIVTAQYFGAQDYDGVRRSFAANIIIAAIAAIVLAAVALPLARPFLNLLHTPAAIFDDAFCYLYLLYSGIFTAVLFNLLSNSIRALGDSRTPLLFLVLASLLNIVLDLVLILWVHLGVAGAALATLAAQAVSGILCVVYIIRRFPLLHVRRADFRLSAQELWAHARLGLPMGFQASIIGIAVIVVQSMVNSYGETTVAAYTAAQKVELVVLQPLCSFGMTMATYVAQNYGAGRTDRIRLGIRDCILMSEGYALTAFVVMHLCGGQLAGIFVGNAPEIVSQSALYLRTTSCFYVILSLLYIYRYTLQGLGQGLIPTIAGIMELLMRFLGVTFLAPRLGFLGVSIAYALAWPGSTLPLYLAYRVTMHRLVGRRGG